jgi:hypothetical protein
MKYFSEEIKGRIRELSLAAERVGRPADEALEMIYEMGLFKLFVPQVMNGSMKELPEAVRIFEEAAHTDGSFGWLVTIGSGGGYFSGIFDKEVSKRLFSPINAVVAGSGHPGGKAQRTDGGYMVSGSWRFCSGAEYATIFTANCVMDDGAVRSFIFTPDQVTVHRDWDAHGLKATGSHTISVTDAVVRDDMTFDISAGDRHFDDPIFDYSFLPFAQASFAAVNIGIGRHFMEEAKEMTTANHSNGDTERRESCDKTDHRAGGNTKHRSEYILRKSQAVMGCDAVGQLEIDNLYAALGQGAKAVTSTALLCAERVYPHLGLAAAMESTTLNRCWRDLHTASQHILTQTRGSGISCASFSHCPVCT